MKRWGLRGWRVCGTAAGVFTPRFGLCYPTPAWGRARQAERGHVLWGMSLGVCESTRPISGLSGRGGGFSGRGGGFPQACEKHSSLSLTREGRAHRANTQERCTAPSIPKILLVIFATFVGKGVRGQLGLWALPQGQAGVVLDQSCLAADTALDTGRRGLPCRHPGRLNLRRDRRGTHERGLRSVKGARPLWLPRPDRPQQNRPANASARSAAQTRAGPRKPAARCRLLSVA